MSESKAIATKGERSKEGLCRTCGKQFSLRIAGYYCSKTCQQRDRVEYRRRYREQNKEKMRLQNREWRDKNRDRVKARRDAWYSVPANREKSMEASRRYFRNNKTKARDYVREWNRSHPERAEATRAKQVAKKMRVSSIDLSIVHAAMTEVQLNSAKRKPFSDSFSEISTADLWRELHRLREVTAENIKQLAAIYHALESRGEDMSEYRTGLFQVLPLVHSSHLTPEAAISFGNSFQRARRVARLSKALQMRLAKGEEVEVARVDGSGEVSILKKPAHSVRLHEMDRMISNSGALLSGSEQAAAIRKEFKDAGALYRRIQIPLTDAEYAVIAKKSVSLGYAEPQSWAREVLLKAAK